MRKIVFAAALALSLAGCATLGSPTNLLPPAPAEVADRTVVDEQGAIAVELAYKAFRTAVEAATDAGWIAGDKATQVAALDRRAYSATLAVRAAYSAGNATSYALAIEAANKALAEANAALAR